MIQERPHTVRRVEPSSHRRPQGRDFLRAVNSTLNPQREIKKTILVPVKVIRNAIFVTILSALGVAGLKQCADDEATGIGKKAREELLTQIPPDAKLPTLVERELACIAGRAALVCTNALGEDESEKRHCNPGRLDAMANSEGENMAITGLSKGAKYLASSWGLEPQFSCNGPAQDKVLRIKIDKLPTAK